MAVQKSRKSRSRTGKKRAQSYKIKMNPTFSRDPETGELHLRHHITPKGYYRGRQIIKKTIADTSDEG